MAATSGISRKSATDADYYDYPMKAMPDKAADDDSIYQELPVTYDNAYEIMHPLQLSTSTAKQTSSDCSTVSQREVKTEKKSAGNKMCLCILVTLIIVVLAAIACFTVLFVKVTAMESKYEGPRNNSLQEEMIGDAIRQFQEDNSHLNQLLEQNMQQQSQTFKALWEELDRISTQFSAVSCHSLPPSSPSGYYLVGNSSVPVYCHMSLPCDGVTGGWMRVAALNMTDTSQQCPSGFKEPELNDLNIRTCVRSSSNAGCSSINDLLYLSQTNIQYSSVCGRVRGYQIGTTNAFRGYHYWSHGIDSEYVDGVSITRGNHPKHHVWTFAAALDKSGSQVQNDNRQSYCPCQTTNHTLLDSPPFVGNDYFCDSGNEVYTTGEYGFQSEPLWDGSGCACCTHPPWFHKQLPQPTTDNIQVRVCKDESTNEDIAIQLVEIYVR